MTHGAFLWGAALYNNGALSFQEPGSSAKATTRTAAHRSWCDPAAFAPRRRRFKGELPVRCCPCRRFEFTQPGNTLRVFERGDNRLSNRGFGTLTRTDPVFQGLQRTRLLDPLSLLSRHQRSRRRLSLVGLHRRATSSTPTTAPSTRRPTRSTATKAAAPPPIRPSKKDSPATRSSTGSRAPYRPANASSAMFIPAHRTRRSISATCGGTTRPTASTCIRRRAKKLPPEDAARSLARNPESGIAARASGRTRSSCKNIVDLNPKLKQTQFADFNGHGWVYRAVYKHDRKGNLLDAEGRPVEFNDPEKFKKAVHLKDIHLEHGMHCTDCHFEQDQHGNGKLYGEPARRPRSSASTATAASARSATLRTSARPRRNRGNDLSLLRTPFGTRRFEWSDGGWSSGRW